MAPTTFARRPRAGLACVHAFRRQASASIAPRASHRARCGGSLVPMSQQLAPEGARLGGMTAAPAALEAEGAPPVRFVIALILTGAYVAFSCLRVRRRGGRSCARR
jgi:hypothetical protein